MPHHAAASDPSAVRRSVSFPWAVVRWSTLPEALSVVDINEHWNSRTETLRKTSPLRITRVKERVIAILVCADGKKARLTVSDVKCACVAQVIASQVFSKSVQRVLQDRFVGACALDRKQIDMRSATSVLTRLSRGGAIWATCVERLTNLCSEDNADDHCVFRIDCVDDPTLVPPNKVQVDATVPVLQLVRAVVDSRPLLTYGSSQIGEPPPPDVVTRSQ
jgi:hypothetical protein